MLDEETLCLSSAKVQDEAFYITKSFEVQRD
jgi:hypothetical protein